MSSLGPQFAVKKSVTKLRGHPRVPHIGRFCRGHQVAEAAETRSYDETPVSPSVPSTETNRLSESFGCRSPALTQSWPASLELSPGMGAEVDKETLEMLRIRSRDLVTIQHQ